MLIEFVRFGRSPYRLFGARYNVRMKPATHSLLDQIGDTPLLPLAFPDQGVTIHAKAEFLNPSGSIKDRLASYILLDARRRGVLQPDSIILECTSGNTGIALAMVGAALGHHVRILMTDTASIERRAATAASTIAVPSQPCPAPQVRSCHTRHCPRSQRRRHHHDCRRRPRPQHR